MQARAGECVQEPWEHRTQHLCCFETVKETSLEGHNCQQDYQIVFLSKMLQMCGFCTGADFILFIFKSSNKCLQWRYFILQINMKLLNFERHKPHFHGILRAGTILPTLKTGSLQSKEQQWNLFFPKELAVILEHNLRLHNLGDMEETAFA